MRNNPWYRGNLGDHEDCGTTGIVGAKYLLTKASYYTIIIHNIVAKSAEWSQMIAITINEVKQFMGKLLVDQIFDNFLLEEATITVFNTFYIDGHINEGFYSAQEIESHPEYAASFSTWEQMKPICYSLIRGKRTPINFKIVLHLNEDATWSILENGNCMDLSTVVKSFVLTIKFDGSSLICTTGTAFHTFVMDKAPDILWDSAMKAFLNKHQIAFTEL